MKTKIKYILPLLAVMIATFNSTAQKWTATLAGMSGGEVTVKQLLSDSVLTMKEPGMMVTSFRMSAYIKDRDPVEVESSSANLTSSMRGAISNSTPGTKIYFEYIKAKDAKGDTRAISPLEFVIK
ncbi:MAG TPA: GldM family protein [Bacteroidia bacterium]|nr:GldM family protein [Bacteroidia bacterium]